MFHNEINSEELLRQNPHFIHKQNGVASYYATKFHKRKTANGEVFDLFDFTAAHRRLPFGTIVKVKKIQNEKAVIVRINDRGPFIRNRIIDLSYAPSSFIDCRSLSDVEIEYINHNAVLDAIDSNYYIGFSICNAPIVFSTKKNIQFIDSSTNWNSISNSFHYEKSKLKNCFLFIKNKRISRNTMYFIGIFGGNNDSLN